MMDFWNFKDWGIVGSHHWPWLLLALLIGIFVGWRTCETDDGR